MFGKELEHNSDQITQNVTLCGMKTPHHLPFTSRILVLFSTLAKNGFFHRWAKSHQSAACGNHAKKLQYPPGI